jgi:hypothetical protein
MLCIEASLCSCRDEGHDAVVRFSKKKVIPSIIEPPPRGGSQRF